MWAFLSKCRTDDCDECRGRAVRYTPPFRCPERRARSALTSVPTTASFRSPRFRRRLRSGHLGSDGGLAALGSTEPDGGLAALGSTDAGNAVRNPTLGSGSSVA